MGSPGPLNHPVILFDGVCNLCSQSVLFIIKRDPAGLFRFAPLQSAFAKSRMATHNIKPDRLQSIILLMDGKVFERSRAALEIARRLRGGWPLFYVFIVIPSFIRDAVYDMVAKNRYRFFGKKDECMIPTPELKALFIS